ncbi:MAG: hypothetical protein ACYCOU_07390 [Sulfobacillus sp.]
MVTAKMRCIRAALDAYGNENVELNAVVNDSDSNKEWSEATPSGSLRLMISNKGAQGRFEQGAEYFVRISET